uniref:Uncharacterized protein n=1 Tax=Mycena chlorophos TaxID=658473 RepID=A0ABQ0LAV6_MYCCL|nr:predicted protein [Mycena chlorophos]
MDATKGPSVDTIPSSGTQTCYKAGHPTTNIIDGSRIGATEDRASTAPRQSSSSSTSHVLRSTYLTSSSLSGPTLGPLKMGSYKRLTELCLFAQRRWVLSSQGLLALTFGMRSSSSKRSPATTTQRLRSTVLPKLRTPFPREHRHRRASESTRRSSSAPKPVIELLLRTAFVQLVYSSVRAGFGGLEASPRPRSAQLTECPTELSWPPSTPPTLAGVSASFDAHPHISRVRELDSLATANRGTVSDGKNEPDMNVPRHVRRRPGEQRQEEWADINVRRLFRAGYMHAEDTENEGNDSPLRNAEQFEEM